MTCQPAPRKYFDADEIIGGAMDRTLSPVLQEPGFVVDVLNA